MKSHSKVLWELSTCLIWQVRRRLGSVMKILVFYFISNEMVGTRNFRLLWIKFSEKIIVRIRIFKDRRNVLECPSKLLPNPDVFRVWISFSEIWLYCNTITLLFVIFFYKDLESKAHYKWIKLRYSNIVNIICTLNSKNISTHKYKTIRDDQANI